MTARTLAPRLRRLPLVELDGRMTSVAVDFRSRLLGLAFLDVEEAGGGLLLPRCSSVHSFGMRFALDLVFLDAAGRPLTTHRAVPAGQVVRCRGAASVLERPA